jgi:hypothetical protein
MQRFLIIAMLMLTVFFFLKFDRGYSQSSTKELAAGNIQIVSAGPQYKAGGIKKLFFGKHYRVEWSTPVEIPVLDLSRSAGGLMPRKRSGGFQSKSLSFNAGMGGRFQFRSIDKDPAAVLPEDLRESVVADIVRDQTSSAHPYSAAVVPTLAKAAGILHTTPKLVVLPDDPTLGQFREDFAGVMGTMEEFVIHGPDNTPGFEGFSFIVSSYELIDLLRESFVDHVDQKAFLKARLLDVFVSDWDRHFDQWRWARVEQNGRYAWHPIPLDRDQAFSKFDGLLPSIAENRDVVPQFEGIDKKNPDIWSLTFAGRHLDRIFLNELTADDFREVSTEFKKNITDEVIEEAVSQLPASVYQISGKELEQKLKSRRDAIETYADKYYKNLAKNIKIIGRDKAEFLEVNRNDNNYLEIYLYQRNADTGQKEGEPLYHRVFNRGETGEIRVYLFDGDDKAVIAGNAGKSIKVSVIGGPGNDELVDESRGKTYFYDLEDSRVVEGKKTVFKSGNADSVINEHEYEPLTLSYGSIISPFPVLSFNPDDGLVLGAGASLTFYGFRKKPYASRMAFNANYALLTSAIRSNFRGDFTKAIFGWSLRLDAVFNPREITDYFGLGNDTKRDKALEKDNFYRVQANEYWLRPILYTYLSPKIRFFFGTTLKRYNTKTDISEPRLITRELPYGTNTNSLIEIGTGFTLDLTDDPFVPRKGLYLIANLNGSPNAFENDSSFMRGFGEARFYLSPLRQTTFAFRIRGEKLWGGFPYYEAAYLGGVNTLRGYARNRFAGDASLYGSLALRHHLFQPVLLLPFDIGWFLFAETGRVWLDGKSPGDWHSDFGGGFWFSPFFRELSFALAAAYSKEDFRIIFGGRFAF